jgi:hypothetical protein
MVIRGEYQVGLVNCVSWGREGGRSEWPSRTPLGSPPLAPPIAGPGPQPPPPRTRSRSPSERLRQRANLVRERGGGRESKREVCYSSIRERETEKESCAVHSKDNGGTYFHKRETARGKGKESERERAY